MATPPVNPRKGATQGATGATPTPMDEENVPESDPTRRSVERKMQEPSNVRPPSEPTPEKPPRRTTATGADSSFKGE